MGQHSDTKVHMCLMNHTIDNIIDIADITNQLYVKSLLYISYLLVIKDN